MEGLGSGRAKGAILRLERAEWKAENGILRLEEADWKAEKAELGPGGPRRRRSPVE